MGEYKGYGLDAKTKESLTDGESLLLDACIWLVENKASLRDTAVLWGYRKSVLHECIYGELKYLSSGLYRRVLDTIQR